MAETKEDKKYIELKFMPGEKAWMYVLLDTSYRLEEVTIGNPYIRREKDTPLVAHYDVYSKGGKTYNWVRPDRLYISEAAAKKAIYDELKRILVKNVELEKSYATLVEITERMLEEVSKTL